jgi:hypothetical protein
MNIIVGYPPNIEEVKKHFTTTSSTIYTYGNNIYNPSGAYLNKALVAHEETHSKQQERTGVEKWWDKYFADPQFRLDQEAEAYSNQLKVASKNLKDQKKIALFLFQIAKDLSSSLYGNIISFDEAMRKIKEY